MAVPDPVPTGVEGVVDVASVVRGAALLRMLVATGTLGATTAEEDDAAEGAAAPGWH